MKLILRETIEALGTVGDEVDVAKGYARNYLIPHNKAVLATPANRKLIQKDRKKLELQALKEKGLAEAQAQAPAAATQLRRVSSCGKFLRELAG